MEFRKATILVVDDNPLIRMGAVDNFVTAGFEAVEAKNSNDAIRILEARSDIHVVFADVETSGLMDGLKLAHYIRGRWPPVKLILVSGKIMLDESRLPTEARFFAKPYDDDMILEAMNSMLSRSNSEYRALRRTV
jgi:DNA-binding NtrC family response regulator